MDKFLCSRCLNERIVLTNMIGSFANGTTTSLVAQKGTKKLNQSFEDRFWCSRCLNNYIKVPDMMRLFAGGATTPLVVKIWTKQPWVKIEYSRNFDHNFALFGGKIWLWLFYIDFFLRFFGRCTENFSSIGSKLKVWQHFCDLTFPKNKSIFKGQAPKDQALPLV